MSPSLPLGCTSALLLRDPSFLRFLLFGEELVVHFPAH